MKELLVKLPCQVAFQSRWLQKDAWHGLDRLLGTSRALRRVPGASPRRVCTRIAP